ncbi:Hypothetical Protein NTJ_09935 [Nesidiocoris tenuis]|uniref:RNA-directed DNA polymerase n=1 Tax=Nesidiocoris tenuis TaxID=355587 RepID=A0ABN7AY57_9HEMI|nr:Hypothetical Protein NTJ_09935 [Nesidiocoris tenuis]
MPKKSISKRKTRTARSHDDQSSGSELEQVDHQKKVLYNGTPRFTYIPPPFEKFCHQKDLSWQSWSRKFDRYRDTSALYLQPNKIQISALLLAMGDDAEDILDSFGLRDPSYSEVIENFDNFFNKQVNVIYERTKFNKRVQLSDESAEEFYTSLLKLVKKCGYGTLRDELLRDRLVAGLHDDGLSQQLQMDSNLTLEKALERIKVSECVKKQQPTVRAAKVPNYVDIEPINTFNRGGRAPNASKIKRPFKCYRCGSSSYHSKEDCKAFDSRCSFCKVVGHYESCCLKKKSSSKGVNEVSQDHNSAESDESFLLDTINLHQIATPSENHPIKVKLWVNNVPVSFKADTGADVSCIPSLMWRTKFSNHQLAPYQGKIEGASQMALKCFGSFEANLRTASSRSSCEKLFVIDNLKFPLLGRPAIKTLSILTFSEEVVQDVNVVEDQFSGIFSPNPGSMKGDPYKIKIKQNSKPYSILVPRRLALPLLGKVKDELKRMETLGIISKVLEGTEWCSPIVVAPKKDGSIRLCVDFTKLNEFVIRERLILPSTDEVLAKIENAKVFSKMDARMGFWQIPLARQSRLLTTFITPFGRYCFNRLPFGISSAPEHFQRRVLEILDGLEGCVVMMDDILVYGENVKSHDERLKAVLTRLQQNGVTLNHEKCEFRKNSVTFLGHEVSSNGIRPDKTKIKAIKDIPAPKDLPELRRFLGMYNYLSKFIGMSAHISQPLRELLKSSSDYVWGQPQEEAFQKMKNVISSSPVLKSFHPSAPTRLSADASSYALGAVLEQEFDGKYHPITYISRSMTLTEQGYAQIEKEALAVSWACERLSMYLTGLQFTILTDHKPLVQLLGSKAIHELTPRLQRFRLRLTNFDYQIQHVSGKTFYVADALSRMKVTPHDEKDEKKCEILELAVAALLKQMPVSDVLHDRIREATLTDPVSLSIIQCLRNGWTKNSIRDPAVSPFYKFRNEYSLVDGLLLMNNRIVIPRSLQPEILQKLHSGHLGVTKCRSLAKATVWWPGISTHIEKQIADC